MVGTSFPHAYSALPRTVVSCMSSQLVCRRNHADFCGISEAAAASYGLQARPAVARTVAMFKANGQADIVHEEVQFFEI